MMEKLKRTWVEVNLDHLRDNCLQIKKRLEPGTAFCAVVKADAYGHGDTEVAITLSDIADWFAVSNIREAKRLRRHGIEKPILILGYTPVECVTELFELGITQTVVGLEYADRLSEEAIRNGVSIDVHMAVDTGMSRIGFSAVEPERCAAEIVRAVCLPGLNAKGIFTHFAVADEESSESERFTSLQHERFRTVIGLLRRRNVEFEIVHCCNTAATLVIPSYHYDMVRPGIAMYGCSPTGKEIAGLDLKPVMALKTAVALVKELPAGETVGYGRRFYAGAPMRVATVAIGYADGYPRALSNKGYGYVNDCVVPVIGNICMDQMMLDVSCVDVREGDVVTLFGGDSPITADNVAALSGTISYEILCGISRRVERVYVRGGKEVSVIDYTV